MKLECKDLFVVEALLEKVWELKLPTRLIMKFRDLALEVKKKIGFFNPEKEKLFQRYPQFIKDNMFIYPKPGEDGFDEFNKDSREVYGATTSLEWENEDVALLKKKYSDGAEELSAMSVVSLFDLLEMLNKTNDLQKDEPVASTEA